LKKTKLVTRVVLFFSFCLFAFSFSFVGHSQSAPSALGVVRLKVRYKTSAGMKDLPRKRFFLIKGSIDQNKALIEMIKQTSLTSLECYYRTHDASEALIKWLKINDCESVYCREIEEKYLSGPEAVPEFQKAFEQAMSELKNREVARRWLTNYLAPLIRSGFYAEKQKAIETLLPVPPPPATPTFLSIMTDRKGTAYLTNIEPGTYTISNVVPSETEKTSILWICERKVEETNLGTAMKNPMILSNETDPKMKCEVIERPLPVCGR
jgi:hypothetical protein